MRGASFLIFVARESREGEALDQLEAENDGGREALCDRRGSARCGAVCARTELGGRWGGRPRGEPPCDAAERCRQAKAEGGRVSRGEGAEPEGTGQGPAHADADSQPHRDTAPVH